MNSVLGYLTEPARGALTLAVVLTAAAFIYLVVGMRIFTPGRIVAFDETSEIGVEAPAVVNLLTNGFVVTPYAAVATLLDLAARGWLRVAPVDDEVVVLTGGRGVPGDT